MDIRTVLVNQISNKNQSLECVASQFYGATKSPATMCSLFIRMYRNYLANRKLIFDSNRMSEFGIRNCIKYIWLILVNCLAKFRWKESFSRHFDFLSGYNQGSMTFVFILLIRCMRIDNCIIRYRQYKIQAYQIIVTNLHTILDYLSVQQKSNTGAALTTISLRSFDYNWQVVGIAGYSSITLGQGY